MPKGARTKLCATGCGNLQYARGYCNHCGRVRPGQYAPGLTPRDLDHELMMRHLFGSIDAKEGSNPLSLASIQMSRRNRLKEEPRLRPGIGGPGVPWDKTSLHGSNGWPADMPPEGGD